MTNPENKAEEILRCETCGGSGSYAEHGCAGDRNICDGTCPIKVQCDCINGERMPSKDELKQALIEFGRECYEDCAESLEKNGWNDSIPKDDVNMKEVAFRYARFLRTKMKERFGNA